LDADWAGDLDTRKSTLGYVALLWGLLVAHGSKRQHNILTSTFKAELEACTLAHKKAIYLRDILRDLNINIGRKVPILTDSLSLVSGLLTREFRPKRKHHDIKVMKIRELKREGEVKYYYEEGSRNPADLLTKPLTIEEHLRHSHLLGVTGLDTLLKGSVGKGESRAL
jgi:hypothetical protein